jgi:hypothetical protein
MEFMVDDSISRMSVAYLLHSLYKNEYKFENGDWYYLNENEEWLLDVNKTLRKKIRDELYYIYEEYQHRYQIIYSHLCEMDDEDDDIWKMYSIMKTHLKRLYILMISCINDHNKIMLEASLLF